MTDSELKDECMENAEIDLRRYSNNELTQIREAMRMYTDRKLKLFAIPDVVGRSEQLLAYTEWLKKEGLLNATVSRLIVKKYVSK